MKAVIYVRCATTTQGKTNPVGLQTEACLRFAHDNNYEINEASDIYADIGVSGSNLDRPGFQSMMNRISEDTEAEVIIAQDISRISRNLGCYIEFKDLLRKSGKKFISVSEPFLNDDGPTSRLLEGILASLAEFEAKKSRMKKRGSENS